MTSRYSKTYDKTLIEEPDHLTKYISQGRDNKYFSCSLCKGSDRLFENLLIHIESEAHGGKKPDDQEFKEKRKKAMSFLLSKGFRSKIGNFGEETPSSSARKEIQTNISSEKDEFDLVGKFEFESQDESDFCGDPRLNFQFEVTKFILENDLSFKITKPLMEFLKKMASSYSSDVILNLSVNKNDTTRFAEAIGAYLKQKNLNRLAETYYSISIDGGQTSSNEEYLGVSARYFGSKEANTTTTKMIGLIPFVDSATGLSIQNMIEKFLFTGDGGDARKKT